MDSRPIVEIELRKDGTVPRLVSRNTRSLFTIINSGNRPIVVEQIQLLLQEPPSSALASPQAYLLGPRPSICAPTTSRALNYKLEPFVLAKGEVTIRNLDIAEDEKAPAQLSLGNQYDPNGYYLIVCVNFTLTTLDSTHYRSTIPLYKHEFSSQIPFAPKRANEMGEKFEVLWLEDRPMVAIHETKDFFSEALRRWFRSDR